ncbi:MAG TPA: DUF1634 domain-containing protein [Thermoleophilia bacterium]|nr:DUF1634 domain-containing protein [Thermoleophilia bacterium]
MRAPDAAGRPAQPPETAQIFVERLVERLLLVAIGVSVSLMLLGVALGLAGGGLPDAVLGVSGLPEALVSWEPAAYLSLGLLVLMATPFIRVAGALAVFAMERDRRYVLVTAAVLAVMCLSVLLGQV